MWAFILFIYFYVSHWLDKEEQHRARAGNERMHKWCLVLSSKCAPLPSENCSWISRTEAKGRRKNRTRQNIIEDLAWCAEKVEQVNGRPISWYQWRAILGFQSRGYDNVQGGVSSDGGQEADMESKSMEETALGSPYHTDLNDKNLDC